MSGKSNGLKQENLQLKKRVEQFKKLFVRMDKGAAAIRDIALMYGGHLGDCPAKAPPAEGADAPACSCQWSQAKALLTWKAPQKTPAPAPAEAPAP